MAKDNQLLDTARDYFQFVTNFFQVIAVSATHIYHSALELSPLTSIVRKFYYSQRPNLLPKVVVGAEVSWDSSVSTTRPHYESSTWSPCSHFVAVVTKETTEILDALSLQVLSTLHSTRLGIKFRPGLAYSPDEHSLAVFSDTSIIIWDTQTGGVATKIECNNTRSGVELVWSLDGERICTISSGESQAFIIYIYDVASGMKLLSHTLQSESKPYLWAHGKFFRIVTTSHGQKGNTVSIFEIGHALTRVESFHFQPNFHLRAFSPTTYRVSLKSLDHSKFIVSNIQSSEVLFETTGSYTYPTFSPDASLLAAFTGNYLFVWRYASGHYTQWREFQQDAMPIKFSPDLSSILGCGSRFLHILHLDHSPAALPMKPVATATGVPRNAYSPHSAYIATTHRGESVVTITNLQSETPSPSQLIKTEFKISEIVLTGNVLLVKGSDILVAWLLTEEGVVNGVFGNRAADHNDSIWSLSPRDEHPDILARMKERNKGCTGDETLEFSTSDGIAVIRRSTGFHNRTYCTRTGKILKSDKTLHSKYTWYMFHSTSRDDCDLYHCDSLKHHTPPDGNWPVSQSTLQEGWVKDPEGRCQLWLHPTWRLAENDVSWLSMVTTLCLKDSSKLVVIKF